MVQEGWQVYRQLQPLFCPFALSTEACLLVRVGLYGKQAHRAPLAAVYNPQYQIDWH